MLANLMKDLHQESLKVFYLPRDMEIWQMVVLPTDLGLSNLRLEVPGYPSRVSHPLGGVLIRGDLLLWRSFKGYVAPEATSFPLASCSVPTWDTPHPTILSILTFTNAIPLA